MSGVKETCVFCGQVIPEKTKPCEYCEDDVYHDVLGSPCKYHFCPMCGRKLDLKPKEVKP